MNNEPRTTTTMIEQGQTDRHWGCSTGVARSTSRALAKAGFERATFKRIANGGRKLTSRGFQTEAAGHSTFIRWHDKDATLEEKGAILGLMAKLLKEKGYPVENGRTCLIIACCFTGKGYLSREVGWRFAPYTTSKA